jgi:LemA family
MAVVLILLGIVVVAAIALVAMYNGLVKMRNRIEAAWAQIDVQLKRRHDLIPNLVETVKGYAEHERTTLQAVVEARNRAMEAHGPVEQAQAENQITGALRSLFALSEAYPGGAKRHRRAHRLRPAVLQRLRLQLQHQDPAVPVVGARRDVPVPAAPVLRVRRRGPRPRADPVLSLRTR